MDFSRWLATWMQRHPLKEPPMMGREYTREVVSKLAGQAQPARTSRPWWLVFPSPGYALVSAAAIVVIIMALVKPPAQVAKSSAHPTAAVLAESDTQDETWVQQTMQLLDQLEDESDPTAGNTTTPQSDEEWLKELETLDEADLAASS